MGPALQKTAGMSSRAAAISNPGTILSQDPSSTTPSNRWARIMHSTPAVIRSRAGRMYRIPSCPSAMPSQGAMVPKVMAVPPAASTPRSTWAHTSFRL